MSEQYNKYKVRVVLFALLILIFAAGLFLLANLSYGSDKVSVVTEKTTYSTQEDLKLKIENNMDSEVCFSSCYPYFLQENSGGWKNNQYDTCERQDVASDCVDPKSVKAFAISLASMFLSDLPHRIAVPACVGCILGEKFTVDKVFYSNEFGINKQ